MTSLATLLEEPGVRSRQCFRCDTKPAATKAGLCRDCWEELRG
jgi:hypothetical protein